MVSENRRSSADSGGIISTLSKVKRILWYETLKKYDCLVADSDRAEEMLKSIGCDPERIILLLHGVDLGGFTKYDIKRTNQRLIVLYAGGSYEHKGYQILLDVLNSGKLQEFDLYVINIGDPDKIKAFSKFPNVNIIPVRNHDSMPDLYAQVDIVLVPSVNIGFLSDHSPNVLVEAMASGCAVIGSNIGGIPSYVGNAGILIPEESSAELLNALLTLNQNRVLLAQLKQRARDRAVSELDISKYAQRMACAILGTHVHR